MRLRSAYRDRAMMRDGVGALLRERGCSFMGGSSDSDGVFLTLVGVGVGVGSGSRDEE